MLKTLKSKVSMVYMSLIAIIAVLGLVSLFHTYQISRSVSNLISTNYNSIERLTRMDHSISEQRQALLTYLYIPQSRDSALKNFQAQGTIFQKFYETEYETIIIPREMQLIDNIKTAYAEWNTRYAKLLLYDLEDPEQAEAARLYYNTYLLPQADRVHYEIGTLVDSNETALFGRQDEAQRIANRAAIVLCVLFLLAIVIGYYSSKLYTRKLFRPIYELTQNMRALREGNLKRQARVKGSDELSVLAAEFNNMTLRLAQFEESTMGSLMEERNRTYSIVRSIAEPLIILDENSCVTLCNQAFEDLFQTTQDEAVGRHILMVVANSPFIAPLSKIDFQSFEARETIISVDLNGTPAFYNIALTPYAYKNGALDSLIVAFTDITEMKMLEKLRSDFIATISHEFKTPLTSLVMGADLLDNPSVGALNPEQKEIITTMQEDAQRLSNLVTDLLGLSKMESTATIYDFKRCKLSDIIHSSITQFTAYADKLNVKLNLKIDKSLPSVMADFQKITWVLNNLLSNALKYTKEGGEITVSTCVCQSEIIVSVEDNGIGIPLEFTEKIFEKYVQVKNGDLEARGTGVGLAVSRDIITAHSGKIWCESSPKVGSTFFFTLPIAKEV